MELNIEQKNSIRPYFNLDEWSNLSECEKTRYFNLKRNYEAMKAMGLNPQIPQFMVVRPKVQINNNNLGKDVEGTVCLKKNRQSNDGKKKELKNCGESRLVKLSPEQKQYASKLRNIAEKYLVHLTKLLEEDAEEIPAKKPLTKPVDSRRYPRRNIAKISYAEEEILSEDEYLYCDDCGRSYEGDCPVHGPMLFIRDSKVKADAGKNRARDSCPPFLSVCISGFKRAGFGIWTELQIPKGIVFGPYKGTIIRNHKEAQMTGYSWQIRRGGRTHHYVEASDTAKSNWMRYVNCADCEERQNLIAFQLRGKIYYRTYKDVRAYTELLVWYGAEYARDLGIEVLPKKAVEQTVFVGGFQCDVCHLMLGSEEFLSRHRKKHPYQGSDRKHRCTFCLYSTTSESDLQKHLRIHTNERPFRCEHCGSSFTQSGDLRKHLLIHSGERPFRCEECGKGFNDKSNLRRHERSHSDLRPYVCGTCGKRFVQKCQLDTHGLIHTGQKPHKCPHCGYRATLLQHLKKHIVIMHSKEYPHVCRACGKGFVQASVMKKHVNEKHEKSTCDIKK